VRVETSGSNYLLKSPVLKSKQWGLAFNMNFGETQTLRPLPGLGLPPREIAKRISGRERNHSKFC
jgi:hypothetical protein